MLRVHPLLVLAGIFPWSMVVYPCFRWRCVHAETKKKRQKKARRLGYTEIFDPASLCLVAISGQERVYPIWDRMTHDLPQDLQPLIGNYFSPFSDL